MESIVNAPRLVYERGMVPRFEAGIGIYVLGI